MRYFSAGTPALCVCVFSLQTKRDPLILTFYLLGSSIVIATAKCWICKLNLILLFCRLENEHPEANLGCASAATSGALETICLCIAQKWHWQLYVASFCFSSICWILAFCHPDGYSKRYHCFSDPPLFLSTKSFHSKITPLDQTKRSIYSSILVSDKADVPSKLRRW